MTKKRTQKRKVNKKKQKTNLWTVPVFVFLAITTIIGLEYIKFKKEKNSFIFGKSSVIKKIKKNDQKPQVSFDDKVQIFFNKKRFKYTHFIDPVWKYHHYKIELKKKYLKLIKTKLKSLTKQYGGKLIEIEKIEKDLIYLYSASFNKKRTHKFLISAILKKKKQTPKKIIKKITKHKTPKIAFIIDDVGYNNTDANNLKQLNIPITGSIIPSTPYAGEEAKKLYAFNIEMMIHLPMQAKDENLSYPKNEFIVLTSSMNDIISIIDNARKIIPHAKGLNNHMGSLITSNKESISKVLTVVKKRNLFYVDSRTTTTTVAGIISKKMDIKTAEKDIFIDHVKTYQHSIEQIDKLIRIALYKGKGVAIGHPNPTTFKAIKDSVSKIRSKGIKIVFVSELVE